MSIHQPGDTVRLDTAFLVDDVLTDPTTVTLIVRTPRSGTMIYVYEGPEDETIQSDDTGVFYADIVATDPGIYVWAWIGTGVAPGVHEGSFTVERSLLTAPGLCSLEEVRTALSDPDQSHDDMLMRLIADASHAITRTAGREFVPTESDLLSDGDIIERSFRSNGRGLVSLYPYDLRIVEDVALDGVAVTDYELGPMPSQTGTYTWLEMARGRPGTLTISGEWGMEQVPGDIREAAIVQVREWFTRDVARFSEAFNDSEGPIVVPNRSLSRHTWEVAVSYQWKPLVA